MNATGLTAAHSGGSVRVLVSPPGSRSVMLEWWRGRSEQPDPAAPPTTWTAAAASTVTCWALPYAGSSARPDDSGAGVLPPARDCSTWPGTRPARPVLGDDLDPGPRCSHRASPAGRGRSPGCAGTGSGAMDLIEIHIEDTDGIRIVLVEVPASHPLSRNPRPALPRVQRTACRITARSTETRQPSARPVGAIRVSCGSPPEGWPG